MKYLKRFEERLSQAVYTRAAKKIKELGHPKKADEFTSHAERIRHKETLENIEKMRVKYSKYGTFDISIKSRDNQRKYNIALDFDDYGFAEEYEYLKEDMEKNPDGTFPIYINIYGNLIPADDDATDYVTKIMSDYHYKGMLTSVIFSIKLVIKDGLVRVDAYSSNSIGDMDRFDIEFSDKKSARKFKNLLVDIFGNPNSDYISLGSRSSQQEGETLFESIERVVLVENSFSSEYGFHIEEIAEYLKNLSDYQLFREL